MREILPAGRRVGAEWKVGSVGGEAGRSCSVRLTGPKAGQWLDGATGEAGDALELVAAVLHRGDRRKAFAWACSWLGLSDQGAPATNRPTAVATDVRDGQAEINRTRQHALAIWLHASASLVGTPASAYLEHRGIDLRRLGRQPRALRYHPGLWNGESRSEWPALVSAISDGSGRHIATHRTWLARRDGGWGKAPLQTPKMVLGAMRGGSIRLWRGASRHPLARADAGEEIAIAEGIETGLSVALCCPELRVLAAVSLSGLAGVELPSQVTRVLILADHDVSDGAKRGLDRAIDTHLRAGRRVRVAMPSEPGTDWNDVLRLAAA